MQMDLVNETCSLLRPLLNHWWSYYRDLPVLQIFLLYQFQREICRMYEREDLIGKMSQIYFAAPLSPSKVPTSPLSEDTLRSLRTPRLSLRFLASYQTLLYLSVMYAILRFGFGFGPVWFMLILLLCVLVYGLVRALTLPEEIATNWWIRMRTVDWHLHKNMSSSEIGMGC